MKRRDWHRVIALLAVVSALVVGGCRGGSRRAGPARTKLRIGVALSGGGYRAAIHSLGLLHVLHERGLLDRVEVISSVSGSSITAGSYAYHRARYGAAFKFDVFEDETLKAIGTYEVPRTVLAAEIHTTGAEAASAFIDCARHNGLRLFTGLFGQGSADSGGGPLAACARDAAHAMRGASLRDTLQAFTGATCPPATDDDLQSCLEGAPASLPSYVTAGAVRLLLGADASDDMRRSLCRLKQRQCRSAGSAAFLAAEQGPGGPRPVHPFADLLHLALFSPWHGQADVRMGDLASVPTQFLINAASSRYGELWTASQSGGGVRTRTHPGHAATWREYGAAARSPRLADAVAASACYPLFCRPLEDPLALDGPGAETLIDGGVHDNLGILALDEYSKARGAALDLLVVADAHRPFSDGAPSESRAGTLLRVHDMLIEQRSAATLKQAAERPRTCRLIHVSLAPSKSKLASLPTDLRPIEEPRARLDESVALFRQALADNPCVARDGS